MSCFAQGVFGSLGRVPTERSDDEILRSVAANVARLRRRMGLTQEELAEAAGLDVRAVQRIEQGKMNFGVVVLVRLAASLKTQVGVLVRRAKFTPSRPGRPRTRPAR